MTKISVTIMRDSAPPTQNMFCKFCHHLFTLKLFQTCRGFFPPLSTNHWHAYWAKNTMEVNSHLLDYQHSWKYLLLSLTEESYTGLEQLYNWTTVPLTLIRILSDHQTIKVLLNIKSEQLTKNKENPPEPVLPIEVSSKVIWKL